MGSSPIPATKVIRQFLADNFSKRPVGQAAKTPPFHGGNRSSILLRVTKQKTLGLSGCFLFRKLDGIELFKSEGFDRGRGSPSKRLYGISPRTLVLILLRVANKKQTAFAVCFLLVSRRDNRRGICSAYAGVRILRVSRRELAHGRHEKNIRGANFSEALLTEPQRCSVLFLRLVVKIDEAYAKHTQEFAFCE